MTWGKSLTVVFALLFCLAHSSAAQDRIMPAPGFESAPTLHPDIALTVTAAPGLERLKAEVERMAPEAFEKILADLPGLPVPTIVDVRLVHQVKDMHEMTPDHHVPPAWADGVAYPDRGVIVVATYRGGQPIDVQNTVRHELAHLALNAALKRRVPRWLDEGFAFLHSEDWNLSRIETLTGMAWTHSTYPIHDLARYFPPDKHRANRAYAQAYDFTQFLARRGRYQDSADDGDRWAFRDFLKKIGDGKSADEAALDVYGSNISELSIEWLEDLRERYFAIPVGLFGAGLWVLAAFLLVIAYLRKTIRKRAVLAAWAMEEEAPPAPGGEIPSPRPQSPTH
jgi:hypothetical protein